MRIGEGNSRRCCDNGKSQRVLMVDEQHTSDERILAGIAYLLGLFPALIIWALKKKASHYVSFHAIQAGMFDGLVIVIGAMLIITQFLLVLVLSVGVWTGTNIIADIAEPEAPIAFFVLSVFLLLSMSGGFILVFFLMLILNLVDLIAAISVFNNQTWRYPVFAVWADKLSQRAPNRV